MKLFATVLLTVIAFSANAQLGIGTTLPNSTLDVRGSLAVNQRNFTTNTSATLSDNILVFSGTGAATISLPDATTCAGRLYTIKNASQTIPIPLLTIATTSSQNIDGATTYVLDEAQKTITIVSDGATWTVIGNAGLNKSRSNFVIVKSAADLPAPVAGVITLAANTTYEINGAVYLTSKINLNGCYLMGKDANTDKLIYTPGSGELFTGNKGGSIKVITLAAVTTGSKLFNLDLSATENLILRDANIGNCKDVGLIKGGNICFFSVVNFASNLNGITFESISNLLIDNAAWFPTNSNTFEKFVGTFSMIEKLGGFSQPMSGLSAVAIDVSGIVSITEGATLKSTAFMGTGTRVVGTFSNKWEVESTGINTEKDDVAAGNLYISSLALTNFTAVSTPTKILGTTTPTTLFRVTSPVNNRLTYIGTKTKRFTIICSLSSIASGNSKNFAFYIYKNGVMVSESKQFMKCSSQVDRGSITLSCTVPLSSNDYIEVWAENNTDATSVTVESLNLAIK